jgi:capsular exopolysaccharide synthesis family protein
MSRIFDALNRAGGDTAEIVRKVLADGIAAEAEALRNGDTGPANDHPHAETVTRIYDGTASGAEDPGASVPVVMAATPSETAGPVEIRTVPLDPGAPVLLFDDQHRKASEQYRMIRTRIVQHPLRPKVITVSSGSPGDGKTFNSINLAGVLSLKDDSRVLLVDGDLRRSSVAKTLGISESPGLGEVLRRTATLRSALVRIEGFPNLYVLPAGAPEDHPSELLDSPAWPALVDIFRSRFSYTIVDAPPVAAVADYSLIQAPCDGVVLVVRQDHSNRAAFNKALEAVQPNKRIGVILNSSQDWWLAKTAGYYYYGNYDGYYYYGNRREGKQEPENKK